MAWGFEDLVNWIRGTEATLTGKNRSRPGGEATYQGIVQPLKTAADFTGVSQGIKGFSPGASPMDQALAILSLTGAMTGPELAGQAVTKAPAVKNAVLDVVGPKVEMFHGSPVSGLSKLEPRVAKAAGTAYGKPSPYVYLATPEEAMKNLMAYMKPSGMKSLDADTRAVTGSIYRTQVPKHRLEGYGKTGSTHWGKRSAVPVKVADELRADMTPTAEFRKALEQFVRRTK